jgi:hypothetical protein
MDDTDDGHSMGSSAGMPPAVTGYYAGQEIQFLHTEASDAAVAQMLSDMMGSPVFTVPALASTPPAALGEVYVFTNGVTGDPMGPFGFQADVFSSVPGEANYSPLRAVSKVSWTSGATPRLLRSAAEVQDAGSNGQLEITAAGVVVNMPMVRWPGGSR